MALITPEKKNDAPTEKTEISVVKQEIMFSSGAKSEATKLDDYANLQVVFAYQMRDQIAVRGAVNVQKDFPTWLQSYISNKVAQEAKQILDRIEQKKWNTVMELQRKFGYSYEQATTQVFGKPLVEQPATQVKTA